MWPTPPSFVVFLLDARNASGGAASFRHDFHSFVGQERFAYTRTGFDRPPTAAVVVAILARVLGIGTGMRPRHQRLKMFPRRLGVAEISMTKVVPLPTTLQLPPGGVNYELLKSSRCPAKCGRIARQLQT